MDNYEAIMKMDREHFAEFINDVYITGLNNGLYASMLEEDEQDKVLDEAPYSEEWLAEEAENATLYKRADDGDVYVLNASVASVLRLCKIDNPEEN